MSKYDYSLDIESRNSLSVLLQMIEPNSRILEFGPAHGRLTKYLKETMGCQVTIVEICEEAGKEAAQFATEAYIGLEEGDIEKYIWSKFTKGTYDYIIFADVLEHLHNPLEVLSKCKGHLNSEGSILVSIPNISHNSIMINLFKDKFEYTPLGLLDETHIHFFTYYSFKEMLKQIELTTVIEEAIYLEVGENEIVNTYKDIPSSISKFLRQRVSGNIYQYIFKVQEISEKQSELEIHSLKNISNYEAVCYYETQFEGNYNEEKTRRVKYNPFDNKVEFDLSDIKNIKSLRVDLIDEPCMIRYSNIYAIIKDKTKQEKWTINSSNAIYMIDGIYLYDTNDPHIIFDKINQEIQKLVIEFEFIDYEIEDSNVYKYLLKNIENNTIEENRIKLECEDIKTENKILHEEKEILTLKSNNLLEEKDNLIVERNNLLREKNNLISERNNLSEEKNSLVVERDNLLGEKNNLLVERDNLLEEKKSLLTKNKVLEENNNEILTEKYKVEEYLTTTLEHVNKLNNYIEEMTKYTKELELYKQELEILCHELTIKGRLKKGIKKLANIIGLSEKSIIRLVIKNPEYIKKGIKEVRSNGVKGLKQKINNKRKGQIINQVYDEEITKIEQIDFKAEINDLEYKPYLSIVMPVYNVEARWLDKAIQSIKAQSYMDWELCIVDDCSTKQETIDYLNNIKLENVKVKRLSQNQGISGATNTAVNMASGEYIILMDNDDELREEALYYVARAINDTRGDILYSDEDKIDINGNRKNPFYKPDWSLDLLHSQMYICHLLIFKKAIFDKVGGFRQEFNGSQDYDLMLRMSEETNNIVHIPKVLYSWREIPTSTALNPESKPYAHTAGLRALDEHLKRKYTNAYATESEYLFVYDARFKIEESEHKVSIIIPTKDKVELLKSCVESIIHKTAYKNYEILILDNNSVEQETFKWFEEVQKKYSFIRVIEAKYEFNWSKLNNHGIREAQGDIYVFLNNDTLVITEDWLERLAENTLRDDIGTVGALLLYEDKTIQHAGVVLGMGGWADHVFKGMKPVHFGAPYVSPVINRNVLACTGACLAISKKTIEHIGGFDENFIICGSDVEISLRAKKFGLNNLYNARVKLYHLESKSRDSYIPPIDFEMSKLHYEKYINEGDPYYNCNLELYSLEPMIKREG